MENTDLSWIVGYLWVIGDRARVRACEDWFRAKGVLRRCDITDLSDSASEGAILLNWEYPSACVTEAMAQFPELRFTALHAGRRELMIAYSEAGDPGLTEDEFVTYFEEDPVEEGWEDIKECKRFKRKRWYAGFAPV